MRMHNPPRPSLAFPEAIEAMGLPVSEFAARIGVDEAEFRQVLAGEAPVSLDLSHRISEAFGQGRSDIWHKMQVQYDEWQAIKGAVEMMQTLYKVPNAGEGVKIAKPEDLAHAEYRQLVLKRSEGEPNKWEFTLFQGWWDAETRRPVMNNSIFAHTYDSWDEAEAVYQTHIGYAVTDGFCYSYTFNPEAEDLCNVEYIGK